MGLLDAIVKENTPAKTVCVFAEFIAGLDKKDQADLAQALEDQSITARAIFVACRNYGYAGGDSVVRRHRRGECVCL